MQCFIGWLASMLMDKKSWHCEQPAKWRILRKHVGLSPTPCHLSLHRLRLPPNWKQSDESSNNYPSHHSVPISQEMNGLPGSVCFCWLLSRLCLLSCHSSSFMTRCVPYEFPTALPSCCSF